MKEPIQTKVYKTFLYLLGLAGTCLGVSICLKSTLGLDAWNAAMAGFSKLTPITFGKWTIIVQGSFWLISSCIDRKARIACVIPVIYKGIILDIVKPLIENLPFGDSIYHKCILFAVGYLILTASTGLYISTGYPKMPIDGLMISLSNVLHRDIKWSRLIIEFTGFAAMIAVHGAYGIGTIIITFTCGYLFSTFKQLSEKYLYKEALS